jgi:hypothetical protein
MAFGSGLGAPSGDHRAHGVFESHRNCKAMHTATQVPAARRGRRSRSGQTSPLWSKITPGIADLAAGSHARRPALNEIREFRKTMPRPRRGSELVFGGPRAAKSSCRCHHTHTTTGNPHVSRMSVWPLAWPLRTSPGAPCGVTWPSRHASCTTRCVYPQLDIKGASICCTERGYISTVS